MAIQEQGQQSNLQGRSHKLSTRVRALLIILLVITVLLLILGFLWLLIQLNDISKPWSTIISSILTQVSVLLGGIFAIISAIIIANGKEIWKWLSKGETSNPVTPGSVRTFRSTGAILVPSPSSNSVAVINEPLNDPNEFYGRESEYRKIIKRVRGKGSTSIVGPRRIGKTWLLTYVKLTAATEIGSPCVVGYLDASSALCRTVNGFIMLALQELEVTVPAGQNVGIDFLAQVVRSMRSNGKLPILCVDEFEGLRDEQVFNRDFFTNLRSIAQDGLVLIVASKRPPVDVVSNNTRSSPFFNILHQISLEPFTKREAQRFLKLKANQAAFTEQEQQYLLEYAEENAHWHPLRLQIAIELLADDKNDPDSYHPDEWNYRNEFKTRLEQQFTAVVGHPGN
jgi:hypothetical protein